MDLKELRELQGLTLQKVGDKLGVSRQAVLLHEEKFNSGGLKIGTLIEHLSALGFKMALEVISEEGFEAKLSLPDLDQSKKEI